MVSTKSLRDIYDPTSERTGYLSPNDSELILCEVSKILKVASTRSCAVKYPLRKYLDGAK